MVDFGNAGKWTRALLEAHVKPGSTALDATMGNGHDTLTLARLVGETGHVYAFDIQSEALANTRARLEGAGVSNRVTLILDSHENMASHVQTAPDTIVFNLGWLPGAQHKCTTRLETTLKAVNAAIDLLLPGGLMTICVYPGHEEGARELEALTLWARSLDDKKYDVISWGYENIKARPPRLIAIAKK